MNPAIPRNERERLRALRRHQILDTLPEPAYDDIALLAATVCETPIAAVSFVDRYRQWFKSAIGLDVRETPREVSFCASAILDSRHPLIVEDATLDERFADNPLVTGATGIRFYAGVPIVTTGGHALGALCVIDRIPRVLREDQVHALRILAKQVAGHLETRTDRRSPGDGQALPEHLLSADTALGRICRLLDGMRLGVFSATGFLGRITEGNQAFADIIDVETIDLLGDVRMRDLFVDPAEYDAMMEQMLHESRIMVREVRLKTVRGHHMLAMLATSAERVNNMVCLSGVMQDITPIRRTELERDRFFNLSLDMLCVAGTDGHFRLINPAFERVLGYSLPDLEGRPYLDFVHPDDFSQTLSEVRKLAGGVHATAFENRFLCKNGEYKHVSWTASVLPGEGLVYAIARDVTERVQAEEARRTLLANKVEFQLAREIQRKQLPARIPSIEGFDIAGQVSQIEAVGGDYFDYIPGPDGTLFLVVGDVSGHGVAPSVVMSQVRMCLWSLLPHFAAIGDVIDRVNSMLHASIPEGLFVTLELVALDPRTGHIRHANCAHPSGFLLAPSGEIVARLESGGLPLGCFDDCHLTCQEDLRFPPGGTLVLMTDGVLEASSPSGENFGEERVLDIVRVNHHKSASETVDRLYAALNAFCRDAPIRDDVTVLVAKHKGTAFPVGIVS